MPAGGVGHVQAGFILMGVNSYFAVAPRATWLTVPRICVVALRCYRVIWCDLFTGYSMSVPLRLHGDTCSERDPVS